MSIFSAIGNAVSSGYHDIFGGGQSDAQKKKQQQQQAAQAQAASQRQSAPAKNNANPNPSPAAFTSMFSGTTPLQKLQSKPTTGVGGQPVVNASTLTKVNPNPPPAAPPTKHASILHDIISAPGNIASAGAGTALGVLRAGEGLVSGTAELPDDAAHLGDYLGGKLTGSKTTDANGQPIDPFTRALDKGTQFVTKPIDALQKDTDEASMAFGKPAQQVYKPVQVATNIATVIPGAEAALSKIPALADHLGAAGDFIEAQRGIPTLRKIIPGGGGAGPAATEVADGVQTVNANHDADVVKQSPNSPLNQPPPDEPAPVSPDQPAPAQITTEPEVDNTPAYQRLPAQKAAAADAKTAVEANTPEAQPTPLDQPTYQHKQAIQAVIQDGNDELNRFVEEHPSANPQDIEAAKTAITSQVAENVEKLQKARAGLEAGVAPADAAVPTPSAPAGPAPVPPDVAPTAPAQAPSPVAPAPAPAAVQPVTPPAEPVNAPAGHEPLLPAADTPGTPATPGLKNARFNQAVIDNAKDPAMKAAFTADPVEKNGVPLSDLNDAAVTKVQKMSLPELVENYGKDFAEGKTPVTTPAQYYEHLQALKQLEQYPQDATAAKAAANALAGVNDFAYEHGRGLAATKVAYDNMPTSMKVAYISKLVAKGGGELSEADAKQLFSAATLQGDFAKTAQEASDAVNELSTHKGETGGNFNAKMKAALNTEKEAQSNLYDQNRKVVDILESNLPKSTLGERIAQSARTSMLSSIGGRGFALINTAASTAAKVADDTASSVFARPINAFNKLRGNGAPLVKTSFTRPTTLIKGAASGVKGLVKDVYGSAPVKDVEAHVRGAGDNEYSHDNTRYGFIGNHITAPLRKIVRVGVGSHLALTKGVEDASLESSARLAAKEAAVPKENLKGFVDFYKAHPPKQVADEAKQAYLGVNNLHNNKVSDALSTLADAFEKAAGKAPGKAGGLAQGVAKQIRTVVIPFSHYMGGFIDKAITDRNALYNVYKIARASSPQELSDQLAHLTTNTGAAIGIGYALAKNGVIVNKDQDGNNYDGMYFHVGNKYIPVGIAGQATAPIIMGAQFHSSMNDKSDGKSWAPQVFDNLAKASGISGTFGDQNSINTLLAGNSEGALPKIVGSAVQQHIPGVTGDINAKLNENGKLNPTDEAPLTKVTQTNPATGRQVTNQVATEVAKTEALIPGLAQKLPRNTGEKAPTETDRILHAGDASPAQLQKVSDDKAAAAKSKSDADQNIPDPTAKYKDGDSFDNAVENRVEAKNYDQAIAGLNQKLQIEQKQKDSNDKETQPIKDQIGQIKALKSGNFDPGIRDTYSKTSLTEWRDLGDPTSDTYDPKEYQLLYNYDNALAANGVSGNTNDKTDNKYSAKTDKTGSGSSNKESAAEKAITSNTLGEVPNIGSFSLGSLAPQKITDSAATIPTIQDIPANQLIKKRAISVGKG